MTLFHRTGNIPRFIPIDDPTDPRVEPYTNLKNKRRASPLFIAEGAIVVDRLLSSKLEIASLLIEPRMKERFANAPEQLDVFVLSPSMIEQVAGFQFHRGVMACGYRPESADDLAAILTSDHPEESHRRLWCGLPNISIDTNLGAIIRSAHSFEVSGIISSKKCADPFSRRAIRTSMGSCFEIPLIESQFSEGDLSAVAQTGIEIVGVSREPNAVPINQFEFAPRSLAILGNEHEGLPPHVRTHCQRMVEIPMSENFDSLNVNVAASIIFFHWHCFGKLQK